MKKTMFAMLVLALTIHTTLSAQTTTANMVRIKDGTFTMGSPANEPQRFDFEVQHRVTVSKVCMCNLG